MVHAQGCEDREEREAIADIVSHFEEKLLRCDMERLDGIMGVTGIQAGLDPD